MPATEGSSPLQHRLRHAAIPAPSDAEKYRWIRAHRGNGAIQRALATAQKDADFDLQIEEEMAMTAPVANHAGRLPRS